MNYKCKICDYLLEEDEKANYTYNCKKCMSWFRISSYYGFVLAGINLSEDIGAYLTIDNRSIYYIDVNDENDILIYSDFDEKMTDIDKFNFLKKLSENLLFI